jgi:CheY-like chemotaxis protein
MGKIMQTVSAYEPSFFGMPGEQAIIEPDMPTVLVVEDDAGLRLVTVELFRSMNFNVITAPEAATAMEKLRSDQQIDLLFSDVVLPKGLNGLELAREARNFKPDLKVLISSGYPLQEQVEKDFPRDMSFLNKPYRLADLMQKLRELKLN